MTTLNEAIKKGDVSNILIHSDQGNQFTSHEYTNYLQSNQMIKSMSRRGNCWDNAPIESFFGRLKEESVRIQKPRTIAQLYKTIEWYMNFYNNKRRQKGLGSKAPTQYQQSSAA
ncbi:transposase InsO family protein [Virgibacillus natechei]|uniref:Transposase InsO family protein n=2 Tax=Virgibacillus natechei TaxID=1216297 RepID=A0ABS4IE48_9BACI|nr:transposase InsO family protein [Virgibacillus natechei]